MGKLFPHGSLAVLSGMLLLACGQALHAQEESGKRFEVRESYASRHQAIALSIAFPGLGQLATGHRHKGTALVAAETGCLVVWLTSHADYNTLETQFNLEEEAYLALRDGGSFEEADESWKRLRDLKDDLDGAHARRWLFGVLAAGVYGYNLLDVLVFDGAGPVKERKVSLAPMPAANAPGVALIARF